MNRGLPGWIDTHCHLDAAEFAADRAAVYQRALSQGAARLVVPAVSQATFSAVRDACREYEKCVPAYGIHPMYTGYAQPQDLEKLKDWLGANPACAIGEIGLDGFVTTLDWDTQQFYFHRQLQLANDLDLPVILHVRRAVDAICQGLRRFPVRGGIAHAFNGSRQQADFLIGMGFCLGFGGAMTYPGSTRIRQLARELPLSAIVLETDAPDIPPVWLNTPGKQGRNEPAELPRIAAELASLRGLHQEEVLAACTANAGRVLALAQESTG